MTGYITGEDYLERAQRYFEAPYLHGNSDMAQVTALIAIAMELRRIADSLAHLEPEQTAARSDGR